MISIAAPNPNSAYVLVVTLPPRGFITCFTWTTESPSIAATSTARAPPRSSIDSAMLAWNIAGDAVAVPNGGAMPGGGRNAGAGGAAAGAAGIGADCIVGANDGGGCDASGLGGGAN